MELMTQEYLKFCKEHHFAPRMEYDAQGRHEQPAASGIKSVIEQRMREKKRSYKFNLFFL